MNLKKQAISGVKWNFIQQFSVQIINFAVQIVLARLLMPEMFGLIAMIMVFIAIGQTLMDSGMTSSLIRTKEPDQIDYSTVFFTNIIMSIAIYIIIYCSSPFIAKFYNQELLTNIVRVFAITFVIRALVAVHMAKLTKEMNFKLQMKIQLPSSIISGLIGISMAYMGYGVWSLVFLNLTQAIIFTIQGWLVINWRPSFIFNIERFKYHFKFGYKLTLSSLLNTLYDNSYKIIIGKYFSPATAGLYHLADMMRLFPVTQVSSVVGKVTYPLFAKIEDDAKLKSVYCISMKLVLIIVIPVMLSLILVANEVFLVVFGPQWLPAVPFFQILAIASVMRPVSSYNLNILKVKGRSDLFLKLEVIKKITGLIAILIGISYSITGLVVAATIHFLITVLIDIYFSGRLISYSLKEQFVDFYQLFSVGFFIYIFFYFIKNYTSHFFESDILVILSLSVSFISLYLLTVLLIDRPLLKTVKTILNRAN